MAESAREGTVYVLDKLRERATGKAKTPNLGKIVNDILEKAGIPKWSKPFVSMRASAITDLAKAYPIKDVTDWAGNSPKVAEKHYLRGLSESFQRAVKTCAFSSKKGYTEPASKPQKQGVSSPKIECAKSCAVHAGNSLHKIATTNKKAVNCSVLQSTANACEAKNRPGRN